MSVIHGSVRVPITKEDYQGVRNAGRKLGELVAAERTLDVVRESLCELEAEVLLLGLREMMFGESDETRSRELRAPIGRRLGALLSAGRSYEDTFSQYLGAMLGRNDRRHEHCIAYKKQLYEQRLGARFMVELRNFAQHRGEAVHGFTTNLVPGTEHGSEYVMSPTVRLSDLRSDRSFSKELVHKLEQSASRWGDIHLKPYIREYVQTISEVHEVLREIVRDDVNTWSTAITEARERYLREARDSAAVGIVVAEIGEGGRFRNEMFLHSEPLKYLEHLQSKNVLHLNGYAQYVSGRNL